MTAPKGYIQKNLLAETCTDSISGKAEPFRGPATASPVACRHQLFVDESSNMALKWSIPTSLKFSGLPLTTGSNTRPVRQTLQYVTITGFPPTVSLTW